MKLTVKIECNTSEICDRLEAMGKFLEANPDHPLAERMAEYGEVEMSRDFRFDQELSCDKRIMSITCTPVGKFAEIMAEFEAQVLMS